MRIQQIKVKYFTNIILILLVIVGCNIPIIRFTPKKLPGVKVTTPPVIDGKLDDEAWKNAPRGIEFTDRNNNPELAKDQTVIMLVYTDLAIYVAWYLYDENPNQLVASVTEDQIRPNQDDWVSFTLDPFHTHQFRDRIFFMTNPNGIKFLSHPPQDVPLEEVPLMWDIATEIVEDGWIVEMVIPWNMLNYPQTEEPIDIGINFDRGHPRTGENSWWSIVPSNENDRPDGHWLDILPPQKR